MIWYFKMKNDIKVHWKLSVYVEPLMSFGNIYCVHVQNKIVQESASKKQTIYKKLELLVFCLLVCGLTSSSRIFLSWRRHHWRWRAAYWVPVAFLHGEITAVPHLLWHEVSVFEISSEVPTLRTGLSWPFLEYIGLLRMKSSV